MADKDRDHDEADARSVRGQYVHVESRVIAIGGDDAFAEVTTIIETLSGFSRKKTKWRRSAD